MAARYAYVRKGQEITILRCFGEGDIALLPDRIEGLPVTALADHIFAAEGSRKYPQEEIRYADALTGSRSSADDFHGKAVASETKEIRMPGMLREIGSYAFYGCRKLRRVTFPGTLAKLGSGIFTACNHIDEVRFEGKIPGRDYPECLKEILGELDYELTVSLWGEICLLFPGYYEESVENTPARIIEIHFEGAGYRYRQCFHQGLIDLHQYDSLFYSCTVQERPSTSVKLALGRICYPWQLEDSSREAYLDYLREEKTICADIVLQDDDPAVTVRRLCDAGYYTRDLLEYWIDRCGSAQNVQAVSRLMDYRRQHFPVKKKVFEL